LSLLVTEVFSNGKTSKSNTSTGSRGLVHLTENQGDLGFTIQLNDGSLLHFVVQIVTLTGSLSDTSEDGVTTVCLGDVVDQLLNEHSLSDTGSSEKTNLSTTSVWGQQIDDLDTSDQNLSGGRLLSERRGVGVDRKSLGALDWATLVNWVTSDVHDTTESSWTNWNHDWVASVGSTVTTDKTFGTWKRILALIETDANFHSIPSIAIVRTTFSPKCCY
jgi:hypothetical protein